MRPEHGLEARAVGAPGQRGQPRVQPPHPASKREHGHDQDDDEDGETDDEGADIGLDERVEIDPGNLRSGAASLAKRAYRERTRRITLTDLEPARPIAAAGAMEPGWYPPPSAVDRSPSATTPRHATPSRRPFPHHGQASPRHDVPTGTAPTPPAHDAAAGEAERPGQ
jgi:hypothetical protein